MKLPNGYGGIIKLSGNRRKPYGVRISYMDTNVDPPKRKKKYIAYFADKKRALEFLAEYNSGHVVPEHQRYVDIPTFAELYDKWVRYRKGLKNHPSASTWKNYDIAFGMYAPVHDKKIISLRAQEFQECINLQCHKSVSTVGNMRAIVRGMWQYAIMNEYTEKDITQVLIFEGENAAVPIHTRFTDTEVQALWDAVGVINNVDIVLIYIYTGMRPSELLEIVPENVHLEERYMIGGMKTEAGKDRIIPIHEAIVPFVQYRLDQGRRYLITNKYGNHYSRNVYSNSNFSTCMNRMRMHHSPHDCRYTFAALADAVSMNEICRKIIMGHSIANAAGTAFKIGGNQDVTRDTYTEKTLEQLLIEVNKLPTVFR